MSKFKIPVIPKSTTRSIRFPNDVIEEIQKTIVGKDTNFNTFIVSTARYALASLKEEKNDNN